MKTVGRSIKRSPESCIGTSRTPPLLFVIISPATGNTFLLLPVVSFSERSWSLKLVSSEDIITLACAPVPGIANINVSSASRSVSSLIPTTTLAL